MLSLVGFEIGEDGRWLAYGLSEAGSDWQEWRIREELKQAKISMIVCAGLSFSTQ